MTTHLHPTMDLLGRKEINSYILLVEPTVVISSTIVCLCQIKSVSLIILGMKCKIKEEIKEKEVGNEVAYKI